MVDAEVVLTPDRFPEENSLDSWAVLLCHHMPQLCNSDAKSLGSYPQHCLKPNLQPTAESNLLPPQNTNPPPQTHHLLCHRKEPCAM